MMDDKTLGEAIESLKKDSPRKFKQSVDLIITLKELNLKKPEEQVEFFMQAPKPLGKKRKVCALVGPELYDEAKSVFDTVYRVDEFDKLDKKRMKQAAHAHDFFIGQANIMPKIAQGWGRVLGPVGKMPNPKAGCIVPPKAPLKPLYEKLQRTIKITAKKSPNIQVFIGKEEAPTVELVENIKAVYNQVVHHLPRERNNVKTAYLKLTMSKPVRIH